MQLVYESSWSAEFVSLLVKLKLSWENFFLGQTYHLSDYFGKYVLADQQFILTDKLQEITGTLDYLLS